jgi:hypothetical protein
MFPSVDVVATVDLLNYFAVISRTVLDFSGIFFCVPSPVRSHFADSHTGKQGVWWQQCQQQSLSQVP